jgi:DNA-binding NarL/FixJ family response regulator
VTGPEQPWPPRGEGEGGAGGGPSGGDQGGPVRVLLADDQALARAGIRALIEDEPGIEVAGEARDGAQAVELAAALRPDVVLMDIRMPVLDGIGATRRIARDPRLAGVHVVILTTFELDAYVFESLRAGAAGFLVKDAEPEELLQAVRVAARGDALLSPGVTRRLIERFVARPEAVAAPPDLAVLTDREREVMALVAGGLSNEQIAGRLVVSVATVKTHVSRAMAKLNARDRAQLVVFAYESGLVRASNPSDR